MSQLLSVGKHKNKSHLPSHDPKHKKKHRCVAATLTVLGLSMVEGRFVGWLDGFFWLSHNRVVDVCKCLPPKVR